MSDLRIHELKTDPACWDACDLYTKRAEVRLNDRDYRVGDHLVLRKLDAFGLAAISDLGLVVRVTHVLEGGQYGIEAGYVLLSFTRENWPIPDQVFTALRERASGADDALAGGAL